MGGGYVYRSLYADGHSYVGKRKIYPGEGWMDYVGSGSRLDPSLVVRKELICFGDTPAETHDLECDWIRREIDSAADRSMVLNVKVEVVDSSERRLAASKAEYKRMVDAYGMTLLDLYLALGSEQRTSDCIGKPRKLIHKFLVSIGLTGYETLVDYSITNGEVTSSADDGECDGLFESGKSDSGFCSRRCQRASKYVSLSDKTDVESMLAAGCSYKEIGERYGASESIAASYVNAVVMHVSNEEARKQAWSAKRSETNRWIMHVRWHVRRNKPNMAACKWCQRHEGFDEWTKTMDAVRPAIYANPLCGKEFHNPDRRYCSQECSRKMRSYSSLFSAHVTQHVRKQRKTAWCWFCSEGVDDAAVLAGVDKAAMMLGCDEFRRLRGR